MKRIPYTFREDLTFEENVQRAVTLFAESTSGLSMLQKLELWLPPELKDKAPAGNLNFKNGPTINFVERQMSNGQTSIGLP